MAFELAVLAYLVDMIFGEFSTKHLMKTGSKLLVPSLLATETRLK